MNLTIGKNNFVFDSHRELLKVGAGLKQKLLAIGETHGQFVYAVKNKTSINLIVNHQRGVPAGEWIRNRVQAKQKNYIYIERYKESIVLVIVCDGEVISDYLFTSTIKRTDSDLQIAIGKLANTARGNVSVIVGVDGEAFDESVEFLIGCFAELTDGTSLIEPVFHVYGGTDEPQIKLDALKNTIKKHGGSSSPITVFALIGIIAVACWYGVSEYQRQQQEKMSQNNKPVDPFSAYKTELSGLTDPANVMSNVFLALETFAEQSGKWDFSELNISSLQVTGKLLSQGGEISEFKKSLEKHFQNVRIEYKNAEISLNAIPSATETRKFPYVMYASSALENKIQREFVSRAGYKINLITSEDKIIYVKRNYEVQLMNSNLADIKHITSTFGNLPVNINSVVIKVDEFGYTMNINFTMIGSKG